MPLNNSIPGWLKGERRFDPGTITITAAAAEILRAAKIPSEKLLSRHSRCDWGSLDQVGAQTCEENLLTGGYVFSAFPVTRFPMGLGTDTLWVVSCLRERWCCICVPSELNDFLL